MAVPPKRPDQRRRRNITGVVPDSKLPISGRIGPTPKSPVPLGTSGRQFWRWVWHTPQATTFHDGVLYPLARLAQLIDQYDAAEDEGQRSRMGARVDRGFVEFGLTPRSMAQLHLFVVDDDKADGDHHPPLVPDDSEIELRRRAKGIATG